MSDEPLLRDFEPPAVPARLREEALAAARAALAATPSVSVWERLLASPAARIAWAASVALLAAANVLLPRGGRSEGPGTSAAVTQPDPELASIARLPRIDEHALSAPEGGRS
ncbi:MAG: hypothetical protein ACHQJD_04630 [Thermoanaerobaculia bacterium]